MMQNEIVEQLTKDKTKKIKLTNDWVFKKIFSKPENNQALKELLEAILNIKIDKVEVKNPEMSKNYMDEKLGILDIKAYVNENIVTDIEMQVSNVSNMVDRDISYMAKLQTELVHIKEDYTVIKKVISINILGENLLKRNAYHSVAHMKFEKTKEHEYVDMGYEEEDEILTDKEEVHYIELQKFKKKNPGIGRKLEQWIWLIIGEGGKAKMAVEKNKTIKQVEKELEEMNQNEEERWEAFKREVAIKEYNTNIKNAREEGIEKGIELGRDQGIEQGKKIEKAKSLKEKEQIIRNLKQKGMSIEFIMEVTGLSKEEIEKIN